MHTSVEDRFRHCHFGNFQTSVDRVVQHTVVYHSLTSINKPNFIQIRKNFVDGRTRRSWPKKKKVTERWQQ